MTTKIHPVTKAKRVYEKHIAECKTCWEAVSDQTKWGQLCAKGLGLRRKVTHARGDKFGQVWKTGGKQ